MNLSNRKFLDLLLMAGTIFAAFSIITIPYQSPLKTYERVHSLAPKVIKIPEASTAKLSLQPTSLTIQKGKRFDIDVLVDSGFNKIIGVELWLSYDPEILTVSEIAPGSFFSNPQILGKKINSSLGTLTYGIASFEPMSGKKALATISFEALIPSVEAKETEISLTNKTTVATVDQPKTQAEFSEPGRYIILK